MFGCILGSGDGLIDDVSSYEALMRFDILHFTTHGMATGDTEDALEPLIALALALALQGPLDVSVNRMFSINPDGALQASEIRNLAFGARLVILSACNSSTAEPWETGGNGGLAAAFSAAGADLILTSHWPVISTAAVEIVTNMMEADPQLVDLPSALRRATLKIISQGVERAHPRYWAPFSLTGAP